MKQFYVTLGFGQPHAPGYFVVHAESFGEAREKAFRQLDKQWAMMYESIDEIHEQDRIKRGEVA